MQLKYFLRSQKSFVQICGLYNVNYLCVNFKNVYHKSFKVFITTAVAND